MGYLIVKSIGKILTACNSSYIGSLIDFSDDNKVDT